MQEKIFAFIKGLQRKTMSERRRIALASSAVLTVLIVGALFPFLGASRTVPVIGLPAQTGGASTSPFADLKRDIASLWQKAAGTAASTSVLIAQNASTSASTSSAIVPAASPVDEGAATTKAVILHEEVGATTSAF